MSAAAVTQLSNNTFAALGNMQRWLLAGGEQKAGLPPGSLSAFKSAVQTLQGQTLNIIPELNGVQQLWTTLISEGSSNSEIMAAVPTEVARLYTVQLSTITLISLAANVRAEGTRAQTLIGDNAEAVANSIKTTEARQAATEANRRQALQDLADANAQLQGSQGFLNGFLTGLSVGAYDPVKENIDKAHAAVTAANNDAVTLSAQMTSLQQNQSELAASNQMLTALKNLDQNLANYQNVLSTAQASVISAHDNALRASTSSSAVLSRIFLNLAGHSMDDLFAWIPVLQSVN